ncbi:hypothetical protein [Paenisporosarcina sp. TG20]|uniref:hypothetical protein n=1 Tax=Paenisporosarcina sp. TG20 TaxID=1211706 RepID=UPI0002DBA633|nr:hypothetical protein [Paenisporosarcina sp. TG20]
MKRLMMILISSLSIMIFLAGCNEVESAPKVQVNQIMDVSQYSKITSDELTDKLGEPLRKDDWIQKSNNGQKYLATSFNYEVDDYPLEIIVIDNAVVRINILTSENAENRFIIDVNKDIFALSGIKTNVNMKTLVEDTVTLRYSLDNGTVSEVLANLEGKEVSFLRVTFNSSYF